MTLFASTALVYLGLKALVARDSARRLAALGGTEKLFSPQRRKGRRESLKK